MLHTIGENAGRIWQLINEKDETQLKELLKCSKMEEPDFYMSLGWLAREGKVAFSEEDETHMVSLV